MLTRNKDKIDVDNKEKVVNKKAGKVQQTLLESIMQSSLFYGAFQVKPRGMIAVVECHIHNFLCKVLVQCMKLLVIII